MSIMWQPAEKPQKQKRISRRRGACENCKHRKIRCDGHTPSCSTCEKQSVPCNYIKPKRRQKSVSETSQAPNQAASCRREASGSTAGDDIITSQTSTPVLDHHLDIPGLNGLDPLDTTFSNPTFSNTLPLDFHDLDDSNLLQFDNSTFQSPISHPVTSLSYLDSNNLDDLFPTTTHQSTKSPVDSGIAQEDIEHYANESSCIASIISSNIHDVLDSKWQPHVSESLLHIASHSFNPSKCPSSCDETRSFMEGRGKPSYSRLAATEYADNYFNYLGEELPYITRDQYFLYLNEYLSGKVEEDSAISGLVNTVLAQGCRLTLSHKTRDVGLAAEEAGKYYRVAMNARSRLIGVTPTLLTIQTLVAMTVYARDLQSISVASSLVAVAVQHCLALKMNRMKNVKGLAENEAEFQQVQRLFWVVYALEKPLAMRLGRSSAIDDDSIDYSPRSISDHVYGPFSSFIHYCEYGKLCSLVVKQLYGSSGALVQRSDIQGTITSLTRFLNSWRYSGPDTRPPTPIRGSSANAAGAHVNLMLRFHELAVTIHHRGSLCIQSARETLTKAHVWELDGTHPDWLLLQIPMLACSVLLIDIFSSPGIRSETFRENMSYLHMASGWFARLETTSPHSVPFKELMQLMALAQQECFG